MRKRILILTSFTLILAGSCVRYIPARFELNKPYGEDPAIEYVGPDAFYLYDQEQRTRLQRLIDNRLASSPTSWDNTYRIGSGDRLKIEVKNFEEISKEYTVLANGSIQLPFVGSIKVKGLTERQLLNKVKAQAENYVIEPQVHVEVINYDSQKVWILGNTLHGDDRSHGSSNSRRSNRTYPLKRQNYSLVELLIEIGDPTLLSSKGVIYLYPAGALYNDSLTSRDNIRQARRTNVGQSNSYCGAKKQSINQTDDKNGQSQATLKTCGAPKGRLNNISVQKKYHPNSRIQIDIEELFGGNSQPPLYVPLRPGDAIYFPPRGMVQIYGEVQRRGSFAVGGNSQNFANVKPTLFSALAAARGLTYSADIHNIEIYRELEFGKKVVMSVDFEDLTLRNTQDIKLRDGDIIWVPSKSGRFIEEHSISAINSFIGTGNNIENNVISR